MNVVKIVVDELPENCNQCRFVKQMSMYNVILQPYCTVVENELTIDGNGSRPSWCPLQLEEVCEWEEDDEKQFYYFTDCGSYIDGIGYIYCAHCGKRVKYESEE